MDTSPSILLADLGNGSKVILETGPNSYSPDDIEKLKKGIHRLKIKSYILYGFSDVLKDISDTTDHRPIPPMPTVADFLAQERKS